MVRAPSAIAAGRAILVGDLNIAPLEHDVWSHKALLNVVSHTPIEVEKLEPRPGGRPVDRRAAPLRPGGTRSSTPGGAIARPIGPKPTRAAASTMSGSARRSPTRSKAMRVLRDARGWERPSDHAPVIVELTL